MPTPTVKVEDLLSSHVQVNLSDLLRAFIEVETRFTPFTEISREQLKALEGVQSATIEVSTGVAQQVAKAQESLEGFRDAVASTGFQVFERTEELRRQFEPLVAQAEELRQRFAPLVEQAAKLQQEIHVPESMLKTASTEIPDMMPRISEALQRALDDRIPNEDYVEPRPATADNAPAEPRIQWPPFPDASNPYIPDWVVAAYLYVGILLLVLHFLKALGAAVPELEPFDLLESTRNAPVRDSPSGAATEVARLEEGGTVIVIDAEPRWCRALSLDGSETWIYRGHLREVH